MKIIEFIENCFDEEKIDKIDELNKNFKDEFYGEIFLYIVLKFENIFDVIKKMIMYNCEYLEE